MVLKNSGKWYQEHLLDLVLFLHVFPDVLNFFQKMTVKIPVEKWIMIIKRRLQVGNSLSGSICPSAMTW